MHSNLTLAMIAKMVIITFGNFDRYSDYKINRGKFEYSILAQGNNLKMLNNRIPSRTSLISTKTGKLDKPLQHLFIIPPFVFVFKLLSSLPSSTLLCNPIIRAQRLFGYGIRTLLLVLRQTDTGLILMHNFKASHHPKVQKWSDFYQFCCFLLLAQSV